MGSRDWRLNVLALAIQYFFVVLLLTRVIRVEPATRPLPRRDPSMC